MLSKRTYLCTSDYDEGYMDFHCLPGGEPPKVKDGTEWYTVCGTPFPNHAEYIAVVSSFALLGFYVYIQMLSTSGKQIKPKAIAPKKQKAN